MADYIIRQVENATEYAEAGRLFASVFARGSRQIYARLRASFENQQRRPDFTYDKHHILIADHQVVSHVEIGEYTLLVAGVPLKVAGVGQVCTALPYQGMGLNARLFRACMDAIRQSGAPLALLDGIPDYYHRFGFSPVIPGYLIEIPVEQAVRLDQPLSLRPPQPDDLPALQTLYDQHWLARRPTLTRSPAYWRWRWFDHPPDFAQVVIDDGGQVRGYVAGRGPVAPVTEIVAADAQAAQTILADAAARYQSRCETAICWRIPPDDAFVAYVRGLVDVRVCTEYLRGGGWMGHIVDADTLLAALLPGWCDRAGVALDAAASGEGIRILARQDGAPAFTLSACDFLQVLTGMQNPALPGLPPQAAALLRALAPDSPAMIAPLDWF
jgi:predicted N-acetyltransferase YhbS